MSAIVGIDLGTTNTTVSYAFKGTDKPEIALFPISQVLSNKSFGQSFVLPSVLYFPLQEEIEALSSSDTIVGEFAQKRAGELPERSITSSKSWMCQHNPQLLPVGGEKQVSAVDCAAEILKQIQTSWDEQFPEQPLKDQEVYVTVPASFAPQARSFVQKAIEKIGLKATLIEEPQAALYAWLWAHNWKDRFQLSDSLLVIDIGGGTTDFSLVLAEEKDKNLSFSRVAVGPHLLLGGDNIDHALAYFVMNRFAEHGVQLDEWQERSLVALCRAAKEEILNSKLQKKEIVLPGRGSKLVAKSLKTEISRQEIERICLDGFFPTVPHTEEVLTRSPNALKQVGLDYAADPRITAHLADFLRANNTIPTAVLFNGGTCKSQSFQDRIIENLNSWTDSLSKKHPEVLDGADLDFAVSRGAVAYGLSKRGFGVRIKSNLASSYFIGVEEARPAIPGAPIPITALCVAPLGLEEGATAQVPGQMLSLMVGRQVQLKFFMAAKEYPIGATLKRLSMLQELHPIETKLDGSLNDQETVDVRLITEVDELGTLSLSCKAEDNRTWKFEFHTRT